MTHPGFLTEFLIVVAIAAFVAMVFERLRLPSLLGFLVAGVVMGPHGLKILADLETIHQLAELGVVLLMLAIGLEFSFERLKGLKDVAILGGFLQILVSIIVGIGFAWCVGWTTYQGFFLGSVIALSSTAIVLKYLIDRAELDTRHGRIAVAILIFQDLAVVPLMLFINGLGQSSDAIFSALGISFLKTLILIGGVFFFARFLLPAFLRQVARTRNREIFFLNAVMICLGMAWLSGWLGLSLAIGAFFAGFMFANTDYGHQLAGEIIPFRHLFVSIFFVSIGLLFDIRFALQNFHIVLCLVGLVLLINFVLMTLVVMLFRYPPRIALATAIILSQIGEFSFLLIQAGKSTGGISDHLYHLLIATAFVTMFLSPFMFMLVPRVLTLFEHRSLFGIPPSFWNKGSAQAAETLREHVIICGFGPSGRELAKTFETETIPFLIIEMNPKNIQIAKEQGYPVLYGDAANEGVLEQAGIREAKTVIVSLGDPIGMQQIIRVVERLNADVLLVVRTRFERDVHRLYELGADIVVMEELEASFELHRNVLEFFDIPQERIAQHLDRIRARKELFIEQAILKQFPGRD